MCLGGTLERGIHQTRNRTAHASEPEQNSKNPLQHIEKLSIVRLHQESPLVQMWQKKEASEPGQNPRNPPQLTERLSVARFQQAHSQVRMQRKMGASEPCRKVESGSQPTRNKCVARSSTTTPMVQIPGGFGTPQNANTLCKCFWQGYPPNAQQNSTGI